MCNAKFDRYCLNDIELPSHRCRRDAINTMELFVFRGSRARLSLVRRSLARSLALSLCRVKFDIELFFSVITLIAPAMQRRRRRAPLITGAIAVMSLRRLFSRGRARCFYFRRLTRLRATLQPRVLARLSSLRVSPSPLAAESSRRRRGENGRGRRGRVLYVIVGFRGRRIQRRRVATIRGLGYNTAPPLSPMNSSAPRRSARLPCAPIRLAIPLTWLLIDKGIDIEEDARARRETKETPRAQRSQRFNFERSARAIR